MPDVGDSPEMQWVHRYESGVVVARKEPVRPASGWVFQNASWQTLNPERYLTIRSISTGRDDFRHAGFRLSDGEQLFSFELGRAYRRQLTFEEQKANPHCDGACVFLIVDKWISQDERHLVLDWLQAHEDGRVASLRQPGK